MLLFFLASETKMKILKKIALVLCVLAALNVGLSILFPNSRASAAGPCDTVATGTPCNPDCGTLDVCLKNATPADTSACSAGSHTSLEWILCPVAWATSKFADSINSVVEYQLDFQTGNYLADSTTTKCGPNTCQLNKSWVIIKNVVSGLVVILMLIMVISQAIGGQLFDAYTVKKMLPRLAIAVILMQFSWVLGKWTISSVNDIAFGVKQIMLAPFGGPSQLDLAHIMNHVNSAFPIVTGWPLLGIVLVLLFLFKDFILPLLIFLLVAIGSAILIALATLVLRNSFIIMAVVFAPVALLLWATPGQTFQGLWKKYADNVMKMLFLFPLIMAMIYTGRIVAYVSGGLPGAANIMSYLVVLIAFFVPYFLLPKTFKWGGQILAAVNQEINSNKAVGMMKGWGYGLAKDTLADARGKRAYRYTDSEQKGARFNTYSLFGRGISKVPGLRRAFMDKNGLGRRLPLNESQRNMLGSGMIFQSQINRRKAARLGKEYKGSVDDANEELARRQAEAARKPGELATMTVQRGANGEMLFKAFSRDKTKRPGWSAAFSAAKRDLFSPDTRRSERAAQWFLTHPEFGIHSNNLIPLDVDNKMWKDLKAFEKAEGLTGTRYNANKLSKKDRALHNELAGLNDKHRHGELNDPSEIARFKHLNYAMNLRAAEHKPFSDDEVEKMKEELEFIQETDPNGAYYNNDVTGSKDKGGLAYARIGQLKSTHLKQTSVPEVQQAVANMNYEDMANVMARLQENEGWTMMENNFDSLAAKARVAVSNPRSKEAAFFKKKGIDPGDIGSLVSSGLFYNGTDMHAYAASDHSSYGRWANLNESTLDKKAADDGRALDNLEWGYQELNNIDQPTLLPGLADFTTMTSGIIERQDPTLSQILTNLSQTPSTRDNFLAWLRQGVPTNRHVSKMWEDVKKPGHEQFKKQAVNDISETMRMQHAMGIPYQQGRPYTDRDVKILEILPTLRHYYPQFTAQHARLVYDQAIDPEGARREREEAAKHPEWNADIPPDLITENPELQRFMYNSKEQETIATEAQQFIREIQQGAVPLSEITARNEQFTTQAMAAVPAAPITPPAPVPRPARPTTARGGAGSPRLRAFSRAPIADTPAARATAAQNVYQNLSGGIGGALPPAIVTAIETAHTSFNAPRYAKNPARPVEFGNYNDEALLGKRQIIMQAVEAAIPDRVFARQFAGEIIARGIAGDAGEAAAAEPAAAPAPPPAEPTEIRIDHSVAPIAVPAVSVAAPAPVAMPLGAPPAASPVDISPKVVASTQAAAPARVERVIERVVSDKSASLRAGQTQGTMPVQQQQRAEDPNGASASARRQHEAEARASDVRELGREMAEAAAHGQPFNAEKAAERMKNRLLRRQSQR